MTGGGPGAGAGSAAGSAAGANAGAVTDPSAGAGAGLHRQGANGAGDRDGRRVWLGVAASLALVAIAGTMIAETGALADTRGAAAATGILPLAAFDWQPGRFVAEPWRAVSAVGVHYSGRHLGWNLAGLALTAVLGLAAELPARFGRAWLAAWPLTQVGLLIEPGLFHYGGLSGVLHAGVAVVAVGLLGTGTRAQRWVGAAIGAGLLAKVGLEAPWGPPLRHPPGWDIAIAPIAHATGVAAGALCAAVALALGRRRDG